MNELNNTATSIGNYNNIPTSLTSNVSVVNIIDGLSLTKEADKKIGEVVNLLIRLPSIIKQTHHMLNQ